MASREEKTERSLRLGKRRPLIGGLFAAAAALAGMLILGRVTSWEARQLLEVTLPTTRFLCSSTITATSTILALMLTLLGISLGTEVRLHEVHYLRIKRIAAFGAAGLVASAVFLLLLSIPLAESKNVPARWFDGIYYTVLVLSALLSGLLVTIVLMLYDAVRTMIEVFGLEVEDHPLVRDDEPGRLR